MSKYNVELLAPAGNKDAFMGAIHAGADAVYLAGSKYGARAYADNFSDEELLFCIRYAHLWGRKLYLTINTLFKDSELMELYDYILPFYEAGLDACIVQDIGVFTFLREYFPEMEIHVSTQMTVTGEYGARMMKELGATRIVPARELSLSEIKHIKETTGLEMETFIHGAMCYCYSGQCLFSSILGGRSGNRGRCAQPCRLPYRVNIGMGDSQECYPLSLKDMCTIEYLDELMESGIDSFKIEGRMKKPEYAAGVTAIYRKYIDIKNTKTNQKLNIQKKDLEMLSKIYIRSDIQNGYYFKQNGADMITLDSPAYNGSDEELLKDIHEKYIASKPKMLISIYASFVCDEKAYITLLYQDISVTIYGDAVSQANNLPLTEESIKKQLLKLGETSFEAENVHIITDNKAFYTVKGMNELRRNAVIALEKQIMESYGFRTKRTVDFRTKESISDKKSTVSSEELKGLIKNPKEKWTILLSKYEQIEAVNKYFENGGQIFDRIYLESELILDNCASVSIDFENKYIALPYIMRKKDEGKISKLVKYATSHGYKGFLVRNIEEYYFLKTVAYNGEIYTDSSVYIWNHKALSYWKDKVQGYSCPYELNKKETNMLFGNIHCEKAVYGRIPMMITANCIAKSTGKCYCDGKVRNGGLTDRYRKLFPVAIDCTYCMNIIYNSVPISLHNEILKQNLFYDKKLMFTVESYEDTLQVLRFYEKTRLGEEVPPPFSEYTTAHEKRGVE